MCPDNTYTFNPVDFSKTFNDTDPFIDLYGDDEDPTAVMHWRNELADQVAELEENLGWFPVFEVRMEDVIAAHPQLVNEDPELVKHACKLVASDMMIDQEKQRDCWDKAFTHVKELKKQFA